MLYSRVATENILNSSGYIEMSKETRNSEFSRKTGKIKNKRGVNKASDGQNTSAPNNASGNAPDNASNNALGNAHGKSAHLTPKSGQRRSKPAPLSKTPPNRARGTHQISATAAPRSPKHRTDPHNPSRNNKSGNSRGNSRGNNRGGGREGGAMWIWGVHAVMAVLNNPKRTIHALMMTESAEARLNLPKNAPLPKIVLPNIMDRQFPSGTVHQGIAVKVAPLEWPDISDIAAEHSDHDGLILVLDQITDPHNVGAMLRLCSAFGVRALVMQDRKAPPLAGATAKVAVGCLETIPVCLVKNIANTLQDLKKQNWMVTGLAGETDKALSSALKGSGNKVIVMGAEGPGLRPRVRDCCDWLARIPMLSSDVHGEAESLNVATAAGIALYEARRA